MDPGIDLTFDCADAQLLAAFWKEALGYEDEPPPPPFSSRDEWLDHHDVPADERDGGAWLRDPHGRGPRIAFLEVPEPKTAKNRLHPSDDAEDCVGLGIFARIDLAAEFINISQRLCITFEETICFGKKFILDTDGGDASLLQFSNQTLHIVKIAIARIAVEQNGNPGCVRHKFQHFKYLSPARLIVISNAKLRGNGQSACPNSWKSGLFYNPCA